MLPTTPRGRDNFLFLLSGFWLTIAISGTALVFSVLLGLAIALPGLAKDKRLRWVNRVYVEVFRAVPILVMLLWTYYGLPILIGVSLSPFVAGVLSDAWGLEAALTAMPVFGVLAAFAFTRAARSYEGDAARAALPPDDVPAAPLAHGASA